MSGGRLDDRLKGCVGESVVEIYPVAVLDQDEPQMRAFALPSGNKVCAVVFDDHPVVSAFRAADSTAGRAIVVVCGFNRAEFHRSSECSVESFEDRVGDLWMTFRGQKLVLAVGAVPQSKEDDTPCSEPEDFRHLIGDSLDGT